MYTIELKHIKIYGKHGVYEQEHLYHAPFEVNISIQLAHTINHITALEYTVNYEWVYNTVVTYFATPYALLETLAYDITEAIHNQYSIASHVTINIHKLQPPITGIQGTVGVQYSKAFSIELV